MKKIYTGPFGPSARNVWVDQAIKRIQQGEGESFLFILPTAQLLKDVRETLLQATGAMPGVHLLSFDDIANDLVKTCDPTAYPLTSFELQRIYENLVEKYADHPDVQALYKNYHLTGVKRSIVHAIGELKRSGLTIADANKLLEHDDIDRLQKALLFLFVHSEEAIRNVNQMNDLTGMSTEARLNHAAAVLESKNVPTWVEQIDTIWIDHFTDFTPLQLRLLHALIDRDHVKNVGIYIPYYPSLYEQLPEFNERFENNLNALVRHGLTHESFAQQSQQAIHQQVASDWGVEPTKTVTSSNQAINSLNEQLFTKDVSLVDSDAIDVIPCASIKKEVEIVAKEMKQELIDNPDLTPRDLAIVARDVERYESYLVERFEQENLPLQRAITVSLQQTPVVKQVLSLLQLEQTDWNRDDLIKVFEGDYIHWENQPPAHVIAWIKEQGIMSGKEKWLLFAERQLTFLEQQLEEADQNEERKKQALAYQLEETKRLRLWLEEVAEKTAQFPRQASFKTYIENVDQWLGHLHIKKAIVIHLRNGSYSHERLKRDLDSFEKIKESLQQLRISVARLGENERQLTFSDFIYAWTNGWKAERMVLKKGHRNGIAVLDPSSIRGLEYHSVYVLGCNDGVFPMHHSEQWLLDDTDRRKLKSYCTISSTHFQNEMEQVFFLMTMAVPQNKLTFTYVSPEIEEKVLLSPFVEEVTKRLDRTAETTERQKEALSKRPYPGNENRISSVKDYQLWLLNKGKEEADANVHLYHEQWLSRPLFTHMLDAVAVEHERTFGRFYSQWEGAIKDEAAVAKIRSLYSEERRFSVSQLNEYINSPLTFFFNRVLGVNPVEERELEVSKLDKGNIIHETLRRFYEQYRGQKLNSAELESYQQVLSAIFREEATQFASETIYEQSQLWQLEVDRLDRELQAWLKNDINCNRGALTPSYLELSFGLPVSADDQIDPQSSTEEIVVPLPEGAVRLYGKIDRIDCDEEGHFTIFDYKSSLGSAQNYKELYKGVYNYQLPIYLAAMKQWLTEERQQEAVIVGGTFYSTRKKDKFKQVGIWSKPLKKMSGLGSNQKKGFYEPIEEQINEDLAAVADALSRLRAGEFFLTSKQKPNDFYGDNAVFRYNEVAVRSKDKQQDKEER
ncbi:PD-(D/E)XK nuclease family protein [Desertibacillus haloalkaliphilus]|uniref:PD-(D/E)XK nuclease family protein n=1 Tax=Desertibacillus haloalkaliphilus TaxID=1328930 RepID=UPI001C26AEED|nr:PD-(D/E)XK nuclease family protein [Desertibacillus haloalkaliphilus]MBU8907578.1 exodeoxyribonuclease V subunit gamma [Desertibacillus haloalkaliphilus]